MAKMEERVKVTVNLPQALVKAAKIAAIERDADFQDLIAEGLRLVLARKGGR
jgi:ribosomal protein L1